jgi:hypothetical protein
VKNEVPYEGQQPDEADGGGGDDLQGRGGVWQARNSYHNTEDARDKFEYVQHPRNHFTYLPLARQYGRNNVSKLIYPGA